MSSRLQNSLLLESRAGYPVLVQSSFSEAVQPLFSRSTKLGLLVHRNFAWLTGCICEKMSSTAKPGCQSAYDRALLSAGRLNKIICAMGDCALTLKTRSGVKVRKEPGGGWRSRSAQVLTDSADQAGRPAQQLQAAWSAAVTCGHACCLPVHITYQRY